MSFVLAAHSISQTRFAPGYSKKFAEQIGLIDSGLGGTCTPGTSKAPTRPTASDDKDNEEDADSDAVFGDEDEEEEEDFVGQGPPQAPKPATPAPKPKPTPTPAPPKNKKKSVSEQVDDLCGAFEKCEVTIKDEMQIKTVLHLDVDVKGDVVKERDLLMVQIRAPPGAVLKTFTVKPRLEDTNKVDIDVDIDENVSKGSCRLKNRWSLLNPSLAKELGAALSTECKKDAVPGSKPRHEADEASFCWPDGLKSTLHPIDPYIIGFRSEPTDAGKSCLEIERVPTKLRDGKEVSPIFLVTVFFLVDLPRQDPEYGDLEIDESQDEEERRHLRRARMNSKRRRGRDSDMDLDFDFEDEHADDGGGKPRAKATPKKGPSAAAAGMFGFAFVAALASMAPILADAVNAIN